MNMTLTLVAIGAAMLMACASGGREASGPGTEPIVTKTSTRSVTKTTPVATAESGDKFRAAKSLFKSKGCTGCHMAPEIPEATGTIGPSLDGLASRSELAAGLSVNAENLRRWIQDPASVKPDTVMPNLGLNGGEIDILVAWLLTLR